MRELNIMNFLFCAKTNEAYCLKILSEIIQYSIKNAYYEIDRTGIYLSMSDSKKHMDFSVDLLAENFISFDIAVDKICFSVNQMHLYTMLKSIKKKDTVTLYIESSNPYELHIHIEPKEKLKITTSSIKIQQAHNIRIPPTFTPYTNTIGIPSSDYSKMCKELSSLSKNIQIDSSKLHIGFQSITTNIYSKKVTFGTPVEQTVTQEVLFEYLSNFSKISGISSNVHISQSPNNPLMLRSSIGNIGKLIVFIKTNNQINEMELSNEQVLEI